MLHRIAFPVVSEWCQKVVDYVTVGSSANHMRQVLEGPLIRQDEVPTKYFHLRLSFPVPLNRADIHAGLTYEVLTIMLGLGVALTPDPKGPGLYAILHLDFGEHSFHALG